jgi:hypothetical protein
LIHFQPFADHASRGLGAYPPGLPMAYRDSCLEPAANSGGKGLLSSRLAAIDLRGFANPRGVRKFPSTRKIMVLSGQPETTKRISILNGALPDLGSVPLFVPSNRLTTKPQSLTRSGLPRLRKRPLENCPTRGMRRKWDEGKTDIGLPLCPLGAGGWIRFY